MNAQETVMADDVAEALAADGAGSTLQASQSDILERLLPEQRRTVGLSLVKKGFYGLAVAVQQSNVSQEPDNLGHRRALADALKANQQYSDAISVYAAAADRDPSNVDLLVEAGTACMHIGAFAEAATYLERAVVVGPRHVWPHVHFGILLRHQGHLTSALDHHKKAVETDPHHLFALLEAGISARAIGNIDLAGSYFRAAHALDQAEPQCIFGLAGILIRQGDIDAAEQVLSEARDHPGCIGRIHFDLAFTRLMKSGSRDLDPTFNALLGENPGSSRIWFDKVAEEGGWNAASYARPGFGFTHPAEKEHLRALAQVDATIHQSNGERTVGFRSAQFRVIASGPSHIDWKLWWDTYSSGAWEPETLEFIDRLVDADTLYIDVGAWAGPTALLAAAKGAEVHAFEPDPVSFGVLQRNFLQNSSFTQNMTIYNCAAGASQGDVTLYTRSFGNGETSVFAAHERNNKVVECGQEVTVPMIDLAAFIKSKSPQRKRLLVKMDIEGAEYDLLPHVASTLKAYDAVIHVSTHPHNIVSDNRDTRSIDRLKHTFDMLFAFKDFHWYNVGQNCEFVLIDKTHYTQEVLPNRLHDADTIIFARSLIF